MSQADLFASTEFDCIDSRSLVGLTSARVQVTTTQMEQTAHEQPSPRCNEFHTSPISTQARGELKDVKEMTLMHTDIGHRYI